MTLSEDRASNPVENRLFQKSRQNRARNPVRSLGAGRGLALRRTVAVAEGRERPNLEERGRFECVSNYIKKPPH